ISALEFMQLLQDIIFLQTPDDRNTLQFWRAVHTVAYPTNHQLAAEDGLDFSGISRSDRKGRRGENAEQAENRRNAIVRHDTVARECRRSAPPQSANGKLAALGRGPQDRPASSSLTSPHRLRRFENRADDPVISPATAEIADESASHVGLAR